MRKKRKPLEERKPEDYMEAADNALELANALAGQGGISDQDFLERMSRSDELVDHDGKTCGQCHYTMLGAEVTLVAPQTLLPARLDGWPVKVSHDLDAVLPSADVVYLLRMQRERMNEMLIPSLREYTACYGMTLERAARLPKNALIMHPGPMNRGVEISAEVASLTNAVIIDQVKNGVAVRMAVLFLLLGSGYGLANITSGTTADGGGR